MRSYFAERLACAYWPKRGPTERPKPYAGGKFPTLILNADTDPITPITMSYSVLDHAKNAALVVMKNGPHVIGLHLLSVVGFVLSGVFGIWLLWGVFRSGRL